MNVAEYRAALDGLKSEAEFQSEVVTLASRLGWMAYHTHDSRKSAAGYPDLTLARRGRLILAELKTEKGKASAEQQAWIDEVNDGAEAIAYSANPAAYLWRPHDLSSGLIERILA